MAASARGTSAAHSYRPPMLRSRPQARRPASESAPARSATRSRAAPVLPRTTGKLTGMCARPASGAQRPVPLRPHGGTCPSAGRGAGVGRRRQVVPPHRLRFGTERQLPRDSGPKASCFRRSLGRATAEEGLDPKRARLRSQLQVACMSGATSLGTHSAAVQESESPRGPRQARRPPRRSARAPATKQRSYWCRF
ncbi:hypothetical protein HispidOSU_001013 [Sigmodon hispidus]